MKESNFKEELDYLFELSTKVNFTDDEDLAKELDDLKDEFISKYDPHCAEEAIKQRIESDWEEYQMKQEILHLLDKYKQK